MYKRAAIAFSFLLCTSAFGADEPQWLKDARAREGKFPALAEIKSKDGWFKLRAPGKVTKAIEKAEGSYSVEIDIGGDAPVLCEVFPESVDLANGLRVTYENAIKAIEANHGKIEARGLETSDAGSFGPVPYIKLSWLYRVAGPQGGGLLGNLKQFIMEKGTAAVYCVHNDLGYTKTFATITQAFAETFETQEPAPAPHFVEISTASMSGTKLGVTISTLERDADGDTKARQSTALLIATNDGNVQSQDSTQVNWVRPDNSLINALNTEVSNGEVSNSLSLKQGEDGIWVVEGEVQGKAVKANLPKDAKPGNWLAQSKELRTLLAEPKVVGREHSMDIWISENPAKLTAAKTKVLAKKGEQFTARGEIGTITANLTLDKATGTASSAEIKIGPIDMKLERVYISGSL